MYPQPATKGLVLVHITQHIP